MPKLTRCARFESCLSTQLGPPLRFLQLQTRKKKRDGGEVLQKVNRDRERQTQRKKRSGWKSTRLLRRDEDNKSSHPHRFRVFYRSCCPSPSNHSQTRGLKRYRIRENSIRRKIRPNIASSRTTSSVWSFVRRETVVIIIPVHSRPSPPTKRFPMSCLSSGEW